MKESAMNQTRTALALLLLLVTSAACAVTYPGKIDEITGNDALNQLTADSAPQQTVVNGWTATDYLELVAQQNTEHSVLLYVAIAVLVLIALGLRTQNRRLAQLETTLREPDQREAASSSRPSAS